MERRIFTPFFFSLLGRKLRLRSGGWVGTVYERSGANAEGARGFVELPEGESTADRDAHPDDDKDGRCVLRGEAIPDANDVPAVMDA